MPRSILDETGACLSIAEATMAAALKLGPEHRWAQFLAENAQEWIVLGRRALPVPKDDGGNVHPTA